MNKNIASANFDYCEKTLALKGNLELSYLDLASRLHKIQINKMYEPNYETFDDFLQEMKISRATANKLINIWVRFIIQFKIKPKMLADAGGWSVVAEILPHASSKKQAERWLRDAKENKRGDLRKNLKEHTTGQDMRLCKHKNLRAVMFNKCLDCGEGLQFTKEEFIDSFHKKFGKKHDDVLAWTLKTLGHPLDEEIPKTQ
jgi:hypothetical protein